MKIGIAQLNPIIGDINYNAEKIAAVAHIAAQQGIELLLTPELSLCGYPPKDLLLYPAFINSLQAKLLELAKIIPPELSLLVGTVEVNPTALQKGQKPLYNSIALLRQGKIEQIFHKRLLPNYDVFDEHRYFAPGAENNYFFLNRQKIGVTICEDLWNDEQFWGKRYYEVNPIAELAKLEVDIMINLSASPYYCQKQQLREAMLAHVTHTYHKPIIYVNQVGANDDLIFDGFSVALNATGEIVARAKSFETDLVVVEYDVNTNKLINPAPQPIRELTGENWQYQELFSALVLGVKDYTQKCGFQRAVFGLSGGIDSALVAIIATAALGTENVLAVLMPSPYSSQHSIKDAKELVANLGINSEIIPIEAGMKAFDQMLHPLFAGTEFGVAEENIQSRLRGNILMAISNKFGHLLLSTGNKSEMAVGYCTLYGDMNGGLAVIADVPKTRVFSLCRWLNREKIVIPPQIITKPPSAELRPGQKDTDSLPPYEILDDILERIINRHQAEREIIQAGHSAATVNKVIKLLAKAEFKRRQAPPILKVTDRAFGTGWRMPIASRWVINH